MLASLQVRARKSSNQTFSSDSAIVLLFLIPPALSINKFISLTKDNTAFHLSAIGAINLTLIIDAYTLLISSAI